MKGHYSKNFCILLPNLSKIRFISHLSLNHAITGEDNNRTKPQASTCRFCNKRGQSCHVNWSYVFVTQMIKIYHWDTARRLPAPRRHAAYLPPAAGAQRAPKISSKQAVGVDPQFAIVFLGCPSPVQISVEIPWSPHQCSVTCDQTCHEQDLTWLFLSIETSRTSSRSEVHRWSQRQVLPCKSIRRVTCINKHLHSLFLHTTISALHNCSRRELQGWHLCK